MRKIVYLNFKKILDIIFAIILLVITFPICFIVYFLLYIQYKHSPIFKQKRMGLNGKIFEIYKFQTMRDNADIEFLNWSKSMQIQFCENYKLIKDPRITNFGHLLRRFSLDELPQLINVFKGEMSLIGPRPIVVDEAKKYRSNISKLLTIKPGITGLWQVNGHNKLTYNQRINLDMYYIDNISLILDIKIFFKTFLVVFVRGNNL